MRLLELNSYGNFSLIDFVEDDMPRYAILSHTWGLDGDEVTFKDLMESTGSSKAGYDKLRFCGEQAKKDDLRYFWVDTCCIDKSSSAELSEAINSMFRWYQNAARCYVFLTDFPTRGKSLVDKDTGFRKSRWFTRGWTLQELIAARSVEFFSSDGERFGDKKSLEQELHQITGISIHALRGCPLSQFNVAERMSWAAKRTTKREEDKAYSLLGIFDIHMPAIYGEGEHHAFRRLREEINRYSKNHQLDLPLNDRLALFTSPEQPETSYIHTPWIVPFERNPRFTGRDSELAQLEEKLFTQNFLTKVAIVGLGGVGKTQLVLELVYQTKDKHSNCSIIWIPAINMESLRQAYLDVARQLGIPGWEDETADVKRLVQKYLSKDDAGQWLLVFDNADDMEMWIAKPGSGQNSEQKSPGLIDYLPRSKQGSIVFTTRDRKTAVKLAQQNVMALPDMNEEVATQLLQNCLSNPDLVNNRQDTIGLLVKLTYLPLAIVQAAAYINENGIAIADYLSLLEEQEEDVIDLLSEDFEDDGRYRDTKNPVATTWLISFEQVRRRDSLAAEYLSFMACVDPKGIPQSLLPPGPSRKKEIDAIGALYAYSFISRRPADLAIDLHRLVHLATRNWLRKKELLARSTERVITRLGEVFSNGNHKDRSVWRLYLPHTRFALESDLVDNDNKDKINLMWRYGRCLYKDGRWNEAEGPFRQVMETRKRVLGAEHPSTLTSMAALASTYGNQGRWDQTEKLDVQVMETRKRVLGAEHPDTLAGIANLASTYENRGRRDQAEELKIQVIETCKRVLGAEHPDTLAIMNNLASTYGNQGRWDQAEELGVQVMETFKRVLGVKHPNTLTSMANLASTYEIRGRRDQAEELKVQVMETRKRVLGVEHPDTLAIMNNLASTYGNQSRWDQAEELGVQVMETRKRVLGAEHPDTLASMNNLAWTYGNRGRWDQTEELNVQVMETRKRVLGAEHPDTLAIMNNLASTYGNQGRWDQAEKLGVQVMETRKRVLGAEHPNTLISMANLASTLWNRGRRDQAEKLKVQVMETRKRVLGAEHPDTLTSMNNLAVTWKGHGRDAEAMSLMKECVQLRKRTSGVNHPYSLSSATVLARWEAEQTDVGAPALGGVADNRVRLLQ
jgi:tetratricopeptide (TPR) repeat protein